MPARFQIILKAQAPDFNLLRAVKALMEISKVSQEEAEFWAVNLPHVLTNNASETNAVNLIKIFSKAGFLVESSPNILTVKNPGNLPSIHNRSQPVSLVSKKNKYHPEAYMSLGAIALVIIIFCISLYGAYQLIRKYAGPAKNDVNQLLESGRYVKAHGILTGRIRKDSAASSDYLNRAIAQIFSIRKAGQRRNWKDHLISRDWDDNLNNLNNYFNSPAGDSALSDLLKAVSSEPGNPEIHKWLGILYRERGELESAEKAFQNALKLTPKNIDLINFLALVHIEKNEYRLADEYITQAIQIEPDNPKSIKNMGLLQLYHSLDTLKALRSLIKYMNMETDMDFDRPVIRQQITELLWDKYFPFPLISKSKPQISFSSFESQRLNLKEKLEKKPSPETYRQLGDLFSRRGLYQEAMMQWKKALKMDPGSIETGIRLFMVQGALNLFPQTKGTLENAISRNSSTPEMYFALGILNKYYFEDKDNARKNFKNYIRSEQGKFLKSASLELQELLGQ